MDRVNSNAETCSSEKTSSSTEPWTEKSFAEMLYLLQQTASRLYADPTFTLKSAYSPPH
jgi:hypothetical protein